MGSFPFTAADVVATYKKHGVKAIPKTWERTNECMCPLSIMACDKLAPDSPIASGIARMQGLLGEGRGGANSFTVSKVLGIDAGDVFSFVGGFDGFVPLRQDDITPAFTLGVETRKAVEAAGLMMFE